jgi:hypothetical protein
MCDDCAANAVIGIGVSVIDDDQIENLAFYADASDDTRKRVHEAIAADPEGTARVMCALACKLAHRTPAKKKSQTSFYQIVSEAMRKHWVRDAIPAQGIDPSWDQISNDYHTLGPHGEPSVPATRAFTLEVIRRFRERNTTYSCLVAEEIERSLAEAEAMLKTLDQKPIDQSFTHGRV